MKIHCSKLTRPMTCAGSLFFKDLPEDSPNEAAKEGTAAGEYLERLLRKMDIPTHARNGVPFSDDMKFYAQNLIDHEIRPHAKSGLLCETRIDWQTRSGITIVGKYDLSFVNNGTLFVDDYKYGWGLVEVKENWQLIAYAIGEVIRRDTAFERIALRIHQPRPHHEDGSTRMWVLTYAELLEYKERIEKRMDEIAGGDKSLVSSHNCKYCPAAAEACPAFNKAMYRGLEVAHEFIQDNIDDNELSFQLDLLDRVSEVLKTKMDSITQLAVARIKEGKIIPNYSSEQRLGDRKWKSGISPEAIRMLTGKNVIEEVMLSPAKAEKIGVPKELVASMVDRPFLGSKLKRVSHSDIGNKIFGNVSPNN